eukprot:3069487-Ditylum_brightwellii.AAC.1
MLTATEIGYQFYTIIGLYGLCKKLRFCGILCISHGDSCAHDCWEMWEVTVLTVTTDENVMKINIFLLQL